MICQLDAIATLTMSSFAKLTFFLQFTIMNVIGGGLGLFFHWVTYRGQKFESKVDREKVVVMIGLVALLATTFVYASDYFLSKFDFGFVVQERFVERGWSTLDAFVFLAAVGFLSSRVLFKNYLKIWTEKDWIFLMGNYLFVFAATYNLTVFVLGTGGLMLSPFTELYALILMTVFLITDIRGRTPWVVSGFVFATLVFVLYYEIKSHGVISTPTIPVSWQVTHAIIFIAVLNILFYVDGKKSSLEKPPRQSDKME